MAGDVAVVSGWGTVSGTRAPGALPPPLVDPALLAAVLAAMRHAEATAARWQTTSITPNTNNPVVASAANPLRIGLSVQLPAGLAAYIGPNSQVSTAAGKTSSGYLVPAGGGFLFGPENTLDVWLVHSAAGIQDIRVLELFRAAAS